MKYLFFMIIFSIELFSYNYGTFDENFKACQNGNAKRCNDLAGIYLTGGSEEHIQEDKKKAQYYYDKSIALYEKYCNDGDGKACFDLGDKYNGMRWNIDQNYSMMVKYYKKSCDLEYAKACNELGAFYKRGRGVKKDKNLSNTYYKMALIYYDRECQEDIGISCSKLALFYSVGLYTKLDEKKAQEYNQKAFDIYSKECLDNDPEGCYQLAYMFLLKKAYDKARETFARSCYLGESSSCDEKDQIDRYIERDKKLEAMKSQFYKEQK